jgi:uncharacterized membrane protein YdbT with pleckstrin-like domain
MSYVSRSLGPGEELLYVARISWVTYIWPVIVGTIGIFVIFYALYAKLHVLWLYTGVAIFVVGFLWFLAIRIRNSSTELAVTNYKVIAKRGFISRETMEQRLEKIDTIQVDQSVMGRILGYGNVTIHGTGVDATPFAGIHDPLTFRHRVDQAIEAKQRMLGIEPKKDAS